MSITTVCPGCGCCGSVPDKFDGKKIKCRHCGIAFAAVEVGEDFSLPDETGIQAIPAPASQPAAAPSSSPQQYRCRFCGSSQWPEDKLKVSAVGWALFVVMLLFLCIPLCWVGLLIRDSYQECPNCGSRP